MTRGHGHFLYTQANGRGGSIEEKEFRSNSTEPTQ